MAAIEKESLDGLWEDAKKHFLEKTHQPLDFSPPKTLDDVRKQITVDEAGKPITLDYVRNQMEIQQADFSSKEKGFKDKANEASLNALRCLKLLGGVVAQGASMVFGPADLCFNAVSLLLDIPAEIHQFHEAVDGLFEDVSVFLVQFKIYKRVEQFTDIDPDLKLNIHRLMISFVDICALSIVLRKTGRWKKFKSATKKVLFDDDSGVKGAIDGFKDLLKKNQIIGDVVSLEQVVRTRNDVFTLLTVACETRKSISEIAKGMDHISKGVDVLTTAESNRKLAEIAKENVKKIETVLLGNNSTEPAPAVEASKTLSSELWNTKLKGSGRWLNKIPEYEHWVDIQSDSNPLLFLTGGPSTGKSYLTSLIIHELKSTHAHKAEGSTRAALVAYHFAPKSSEKSNKDQTPSTTALKCLAVQIAEQDPAYSKTISQWCKNTDEDQHFKDGDCKWFWQQLKFIAPTRQVTYFLLFDGVDQWEDVGDLLGILGGLQSSLPDSDRHQIRVLVTGKAETFREDIFPGVPRIHLPQNNSPEIGFAIDQRLKGLDLFQEQDPETLKWREMIHDQLQQHAGGDFFKVYNVLDQINDLVGRNGLFEELQGILSNAGQDRRKIAQNAIDAANEDMDADEIEELNELLIWVLFVENPFDISMLQAVLYLRFRKKTLQTLKKKLEGKYAKFFEINGGCVSMKADIMQIVTMTSRRQKPEDIPRITATIAITKADFKTAQSFLWKLCETAMGDFAFNEQAAQTKIKDNIGVNAFDAHLWIVKQTFKLLLSKPDDMTKATAGYMFGYLPTHLRFLKEATEFSGLMDEEKKEIGSGIFSLIVKGDVLETYWDSCGPPENRWDDVGISALWEWLKDPEATRYLGTKDNEWLEQLKLEANPNRSLMQPVIEMIAKNWLRDRKWKAADTWWWIHSFLMLPKAKQETDTDTTTKSEVGETDNRGERNPDDDIDSDSFISMYEDAAKVSKAAKWAQRILKIKNGDSLWYERLGETYSSLWEIDSAIDAFKEAIKRGSPSWKCYEGLALAFENKEDLSSAAPEMEKALKVLRDMSERDEYEQKRLLEDLLIMASWQTDLQQLESAITYYKEVALIDSYKYESHYGLFKTLMATGKEEPARALLRDLHEKTAKDSTLSQLCAMFPSLIGDQHCDLVFGMMFSATQETAFFTTVLEDLDNAIELAQKEKDRLSDVAAMLIYKGIAIYHYDKRKEQAPELALVIWEQCGDLLNRSDQSWMSRSTYFRASRLISAHHFNKAVKATVEAEDPKLHVEKMQLVANQHVSFNTDAHAKTYLGAYYVLSKDPQDCEKAKTIFLADIKSALELLSDDIDWNDYQGYYSLAELLMHAGDDLNALSAWSLLGPTDLDTPEEVLQFNNEATKKLALELLGIVQSKLKPEAPYLDIFEALKTECESRRNIAIHEGQVIDNDNAPFRSLTDISFRLMDIIPSYGEVAPGKRNGNLSNYCDGLCGKRWKFADDFYCCKFCPDLQLCGVCHDKLIHGKLQSFVCNRDHKWLHVPKWDDKEYAKVGKGNVMVGGEMKDGVRVGGNVVSIAEWLNIVRDDRGIPRREKPVEQGQTQSVEATEPNPPDQAELHSSTESPGT